MRDKIESWAEENDIKIMFADGFDEAIVGVTESESDNDDDGNYTVVYSEEKCIRILMADMDYLEAREYFDTNVSGSYVGKLTPIYIMTFDNH